MAVRKGRLVKREGICARGEKEPSFRLKTRPGSAKKGETEGEKGYGGKGDNPSSQKVPTGCHKNVRKGKKHSRTKKEGTGHFTKIESAQALEKNPLHFPGERGIREEKGRWLS